MTNNELPRPPTPDPRPLKAAFTLLELTIVLAIIGLVAAGAMTVMTNYLQASAYNNTVAEMNTIEQALLNFSVANGRIPCPTNLTCTMGQLNYGAEGNCASNTLSCTTGTTGVNYTVSSSGVAEGGVPTRALRLPDSYQFDAWGRRFRYAVDPTQTVSGALPAAVGSCPSPSPITVTGTDGLGSSYTRSGAAAYALVSHGQNGHGAYTSKGVTINAASDNAQELVNCHCNSSGVATSGPFVASYVQQLPSLRSSDANNVFDDIVTFKEPWQLQTLNNPIGTSLCLYAASNSSLSVVYALSNGSLIGVAGNGTASYGGDGSTATLAELNYPQGLTVDSAGNLYIADRLNNRIRKVTAAGTISTFAGTTSAGYSGDGGAANLAKLSNPSDVYLDSSGNLYIADTNNYRIREVYATSGFITTFAGGVSGSGGDGGNATLAGLQSPKGVSIDSSGNLYIADSGNGDVREVYASSNKIATLAGSLAKAGSYSGDGNAATLAALNQPSGVAIDSSGNVYIADMSNNLIREVYATSSKIITYAGYYNSHVGGYSGDGSTATFALLNEPISVRLDSSGNLYIADQINNRIREVYATSGIITTIASTGNYMDGVAIGR